MERPVRDIGVAVIGYGWMGRVHAQAYQRLIHHYPGLGVRPRLLAVADPVAERRADAERRFGLDRAVEDWHGVLADPDVEVVSVTAPNHLHREIGTAVAASGRHLWIEKPVGLSAADAVAVADAVRSAGVASAVGFNYRNAPAVEHARRLIADGAIGTVTNAHFRWLADYAAHPDGALTWRFTSALGGSGVVADLVSHGVDLAWFLLGDIDEVVADEAVFVPSRPRATGAVSHFATAEGGEPGDVENPDYVAALLRFAGGARATLEASRVSVGDQCTYAFEVHGTRGSVSWDFRRMGELVLSRGDAYLNQGVETRYVGPEQGEYEAFQPAAAVAMGYDDLKVIEAARLLRSVADGRPHGATIDDAVRAAGALDALTTSTASGGWVAVRR